MGPKMLSGRLTPQVVISYDNIMETYAIKQIISLLTKMHAYELISHKTSLTRQRVEIGSNMVQREVSKAHDFSDELV